MIIVIITTDERMRSVIVERERQLISLFDFILTEQFLWSCPSIDLTKFIMAKMTGWIEVKNNQRANIIRSENNKKLLPI